MHNLCSPPYPTQNRVCIRCTYDPIVPPGSQPCESRASASCHCDGVLTLTNVRSSGSRERSVAALTFRMRASGQKLSMRRKPAANDFSTAGRQRRWYTAWRGWAKPCAVGTIASISLSARLIKCLQTAADTKGISPATASAQPSTRLRPVAKPPSGPCPGLSSGKQSTRTWATGFSVSFSAPLSPSCRNAAPMLASLATTSALEATGRSCSTTCRISGMPRGGTGSNSLSSPMRRLSPPAIIKSATLSLLQDVGFTILIFGAPQSPIKKASCVRNSH